MARGLPARGEEGIVVLCYLPKDDSSRRRGKEAGRTFPDRRSMNSRRSGQSLSVKSDRISMKFGGGATVISSVRNLPTGTEVCRKGRLSILVRTPRALFDPTFLTETESFEQRDGSLRVVLADETRRYRAELTITPTADGLEHHLVVDSPEPIWI